MLSLCIFKCTVSLRFKPTKLSPFLVYLAGCFSSTVDDMYCQKQLPTRTIFPSVNYAFVKKLFGQPLATSFNFICLSEKLSGYQYFSLSFVAFFLPWLTLAPILLLLIECSWFTSTHLLEKMFRFSSTLIEIYRRRVGIWTCRNKA